MFMNERQKKHIGRIAVYSAVLLVILAIAFFWGGTKPDKEALAPLIGVWDCQERPLEDAGKEDYRYVGYLILRVEEDGTFSMYDAEAGNPGISGTMYPEEDGTVLLACDEDDFDPPHCWAGIKENSRLQFDITKAGETEVLHLAYTDEEGRTNTLAFDRME